MAKGELASIISTDKESNKPHGQAAVRTGRKSDRHEDCSSRRPREGPETIFICGGQMAG